MISLGLNKNLKKNHALSSLRSLVIKPEKFEIHSTSHKILLDELSQVHFSLVSYPEIIEIWHWSGGRSSPSSRQIR